MNSRSTSQAVLPYTRRVVAQIFLQVPFVDYRATFAPVAKVTVRFGAIYSALKGWDLQGFDTWSRTFLWDLTIVIFMRRPPLPPHGLCCLVMWIPQEMTSTRFSEDDSYLAVDSLVHAYRYLDSSLLFLQLSLHLDISFNLQFLCSRSFFWRLFLATTPLLVVFYSISRARDHFVCIMESGNLSCWRGYRMLFGQGINPVVCLSRVLCIRMEAYQLVSNETKWCSAPFHQTFHRSFCSFFNGIFTTFAGFFSNFCCFCTVSKLDIPLFTGFTPVSQSQNVTLIIHPHQNRKPCAMIPFTTFVSCNVGQIIITLSSPSFQVFLTIVVILIASRFCRTAGFSLVYWSLSLFLLFTLLFFPVCNCSFHLWWVASCRVW